MRVLFYEDPATDQNAFFWRAPHILLDARWLIALREAGVDARMLTHDRLAAFADAQGVARDARFTVREDDVVATLPEPLLNYNSMFHRQLGALEADTAFPPGEHLDRDLAARVRDGLERVIHDALGDFTPDVIIAWVPTPHLRRLFPEALILHKETSLFSRAPFPRTYYLDPLGFHRWSAFARSATFVPSDAALAALGPLRAHYDRVFDLTDRVVGGALHRKLSAFDRTILVAGVTNGVFTFDAACAYRSQTHALLDVLDHAPAHVGVLYARHPDCVGLSAPEVAYLATRYPNFVWDDELATAPYKNQHLVRHVSALATVGSSVGLQAAFWGKPVIALGHSHINRVAAAQGARDLMAALDGAAAKDSDVAFLAFHYSVLDEKVGEPGWLAAFLQGRLAHWRAQGAKGYFDAPVIDPETFLALAFAATEASVSAMLPPLVPSDPASLLDLADDRIFSAGWGSAESAGGPAYRWLTGARGEIVLRLDPTTHWTLGLHLAAAPGVAGQHATLKVGGRTVGVAIIPKDGGTGLIATLPPELVTSPATRFELTAAFAEAPAHEPRPLSICVGQIEAIPAPLPSARTERARPPHGVVIPTLNGFDALRVTLPALLATAPDDLELVVSDNWSDDETWDYLQSLTDPRLRLVRPPERVDYATNADFAYRETRADYVGHLGDDDLTAPGRFEAVARIFAETDADLILGGRLRYFWPDFPDPALASRLDPARFGDVCPLLLGRDAAARLINASNVRHTAATVMRRELIDRVRTLNGGRFLEPRLAEYAGFRVAAGLARRVAFPGRPLAVVGRHAKSIGTALFHKPTAKYGVDLERDIGSRHGHAGFNYLGFQPFSFDGALRAAEILAPTLGEIPVDFALWRDRIFAELDAQVARGALGAEGAERIREEGASRLFAALGKGAAPQPFGTPRALSTTDFGWEEPRDMAAEGIGSIAALVDWLAGRFGERLGAGSLVFETDGGAWSWRDE